jgi:DNA-binding NarL/FixJ family response regulator
MAGTVKVIVVDDHSLFRAGVVQSLLLDASIRVIAEGSTGPDAIRLAKQHMPDVMLLDISMPGNGIEAAAAIANLSNAPKIAMLTVSEAGHDVIRAVEAGAVGYILKGIVAPDLIAVIKSISAGECFMSPNLSLNLLNSIRKTTKTNLMQSLSRQEERALQLVAEGLSNREIGERLGIREKTVKYHMSSILKKLNVRNRVEAALLARKEWDDQS